MKLKKLLLPLATSLILNHANAETNPNQLIKSIPIDIQLANTHSDIKNILMGTLEETKKELSNVLIESIKLDYHWNEDIEKELEGMNWRELAKYNSKVISDSLECNEKNELAWDLYAMALEINENKGIESNPITLYSNLQKIVFWHKRTNSDSYSCD